MNIVPISPEIKKYVKILLTELPKIRDSYSQIFVKYCQKIDRKVLSPTKSIFIRDEGVSQREYSYFISRMDEAINHLKTMALLVEQDKHRSSSLIRECELYLSKLDSATSFRNVFIAEIEKQGKQEDIELLKEIRKRNVVLNKISIKISNILKNEQNSHNFSSENYRLYDSFQIGKKHINLKIIGRYNVFSRLGAGSKMLEYITKLIDGSTTKISSDRKDFLRKDMLENHGHTICNEILKLVRNTVIHVLDSMQDLLLADTINLNISIIPNDKGNSGSYDKCSYYDNIFISLILDYEFIREYLFGYAPGKEMMHVNSYKYNTLVHEISHSFDWVLNSSPALFNDRVIYEVVKNMTGETPVPEVVSFVEILSKLRSEGLARINGNIRPKLFNKVGVVCLDLFFYNLQTRNKIISLASIIKNGELSNLDIINEVKRIYDSGETHNLGEAMAFLIMISKLKSRIYFIVTGEYLPIGTLENLSKDETYLDVLKAYNTIVVVKAQDLKDIYQDILKGHKHLYMIILKDACPYFKEFIKVLSLMRIDNFLDAYSTACKDIGLPFPIVDREMLREMNDKIHKDISYFASSQGFDKAT